MVKRRPIPMPEDRPTVSVEEAAEWIGLSRASAYRAAKTGELPTITFGHRRVVPTAALRHMLGLDVAAATTSATTTPAATTPVSVMADSVSQRLLSPPAPRRRRNARQRDAERPTPAPKPQRRRRDVSTTADGQHGDGEIAHARVGRRRAPARPAQS